MTSLPVHHRKRPVPRGVTVQGAREGRFRWMRTLLLASVIVATATANPGQYDSLERRRLHGSHRYRSVKEVTTTVQRRSSYRSYNNNQQGHSRKRHAALSDVWLCLLCAFGWTVWLVSMTRPENEVEPSLFEAQESRTVHGNVLQVTLGEDADGTGIPVYHTLVDYVVESELTDEEPLQVRKCFSTRTLLEEGFANVEVLVLSEDPTTSMLMEDFREEKNNQDTLQQEPQSIMWTVAVYVAASVLITISLAGAWLAYSNLDPDEQLYGKLSLTIGVLILYPAAVFLYYVLTMCTRWAAPLTERPGVVIHGAKNWTRHCGATLNPWEVMGSSSEEATPPNTEGVFRKQAKSPPIASTANAEASTPPNANAATLELPPLRMPRSSDMSNTNQTDSNVFGGKAPSTPRSPLYPNAGCGFGKFNVHMPKMATTNEGESGTSEDLAQMLSNESVSSMSSGTQGTGMSSNAGNTEKGSYFGESLRMPSMLEAYEAIISADTTFISASRSEHGGKAPDAPSTTSGKRNKRPSTPELSRTQQSK